jgi:hypothetical protein
MIAVIVALTFTMALVGAIAVLLRTIIDERDTILVALSWERPVPQPRPEARRFTPPPAARRPVEWRVAA